ncbi:MAG: helix-turn-helix domain-containing protein [Elioraea tepidiphila]
MAKNTICLWYDKDAEAAARFGLGPRRLTPAALASLADHDWPGNVRELRNRIERGVALAEGEDVGPGDLFPELSLDREDGPVPPSGTTLDAALGEAMRAAILDALRHSGGSRAGAAQRLGISRTTLWKRMRELGIGQEC